MTDFEIHRFVEPYKILNKYALTKDEWMDVSHMKGRLFVVIAMADSCFCFGIGRQSTQA